MPSPAFPRRTAGTLLGLLLAVGCSTTNGGAGTPSADSAAVTTPAPTRQGRDSTPPSPPGSPGADTAGEPARIARLEREARALARTSGCTSADGCRMAPVGARPCGGPRAYVAYCSASTDTVALFRALRALERAEQAYNERSGMLSTCEFRTPPGVALVGGSCRETSGTGAVSP